MPSEFDSNFNPNNYTTNPLPGDVGNALNLSATVEYGAPDESQGNATYSVTITVRDSDNPDTDTNTIAVVTIQKPNFNKSLVIAKINSHFFKIIKTVSEDTFSPRYLTGVATQPGNQNTGSCDLLDGVVVYYTDIAHLMI